MSISALAIRNFRSIVNFNDEVQNLNIFVGQNDEGKSNVLRALDLFFNHDKKNGYDLDWSRDYCYFAPKRSRKAEEITVQLSITPPSSFRNRTPVVWKKVWRKEGLHIDIYKHRDGSEVKPKSKIAAFIKAMRFDYVPAIKGEEYFQSLMSNLHDMLEATVEEQVRDASGLFTKTINDNTKDILKQIQERLGLETTIELPPNLRDLFAQLEFTSISGEQPFSLKQRGDGIKVRHIPIVLRWLADQANYLSAPGRPKTVTVWGYEEPENNLELRRCFELAQEFVEGSETIQAFVTTHSPAFYSVCRESDPKRVRLFFVTKDDSPPISKIQPLSDKDIKSLDSSMGLLDFLEPHFKEAREELERLRSASRKLTDTSKPTIFCEGPSDKNLLEEVLCLFYPDQNDSVTVQCSGDNGGGHAWVSDMMIAWSFVRPQANAVGLFDKDNEAQKTKTETNSKLKKASQNKVFGVSLIPGDDLKECFKQHVSVPFAIEELLPKDVWDHAESQGWLEPRPDPISLYGFTKTDVTFSEHFNALLPDSHIRRIALQKVKLESKGALCNYICGLDENEKKRVLTGLIPTVKECLKKLQVIEDQV